jgi:hypothetical protein
VKKGNRLHGLDVGLYRERDQEGRWGEGEVDDGSINVVNGVCY